MQTTLIAIAKPPALNSVKAKKLFYFSDYLKYLAQYLYLLTE